MRVFAPVASKPRGAPNLAGITGILGPSFASRETAADENDRFVAENYKALRESGLSAAGVPTELGGGGLSHAELGQILRELAHYSGSTALAFSMHSHQVMVAAWRREHDKAPTDALLRRVAQEKIILVSSGGSDWLPSSGTAKRVEGGYRIDARKIFASGSPAGDVLLTSAIDHDAENGPTVLHFAIPMTAVRIEPNWRTLGMRGTGSHSLIIENFFLPDAGVAGRRQPGKWHKLFHITTMMAFPLVYGVYLGVAERARALAVQHARKPADADVVQLFGALDTELAAARFAWNDMLDAAAENRPGPEITNRVFMGRALVARAVLKAVELAMEAAGGASFYRSAEIERCFRDAQGARFHALRDGAQQTLAGRMALGLDIDD